MNQGLWLLTNQLYRPTSKSVTPALCIRFAVDGGSSTFKNIWPFFRSIPKKCHCGQASAPIAGMIPDAGDAVTNRDACQTGAVHEGSLPDAGDSIRYRDALQAMDGREGIIPDAGDTITNRDARQAGAVPEGLKRDARDRISLNCVGNDQLAGGGFIAISNSDFAVSGGVSQVAEVCSVERQDPKQEEGKERCCKILHVICYYHIASGSRSTRSWTLDPAPDPCYMNRRWCGLKGSPKNSHGSY